MKTIVISGAAGFIGSHLSESFLRKNDHVIGLDNFATGQKSNIDVLRNVGLNNFTFIEQDVCNSWNDLIPPSSQSTKIKYVFHLASPAAVNQYQQLSLETLWANSLGLKNALEFSDKFQARLIFASTSEIYGSPLSSPQKESDWGYVNSFGPRSCYDEAKRFAEALIFEHNRKYKTQHGLVRIFNTYGPRMNPDDGRVVTHMIRKALREEDLVIYGDGLQTRSFCFIDDLITGLELYADSDATQPINLGNDKEIKINELAQLILKLTGSNSKIKHTEALSDDPLQRKPDLSKAYSVIRYQPKIDIELGLKKMIEYLKVELTNGNE